MRKGNIHKKMTFEDKFDRHYACWVINNRKAWRFWKRKNRKDFRRQMKQLLIDEVENNYVESNETDSCSS